jgi:hypothetical protein
LRTIPKEFTTILIDKVTIDQFLIENRYFIMKNPLTVIAALLMISPSRLTNTNVPRPVLIKVFED